MRIGGPFSTPSTNYRENDIESSENLQNKDVESQGLTDKSYQPFMDHLNNRKDLTTGLHHLDNFSPNPSKEARGHVDDVLHSSTDDRDFVDQDSEGARTNHLTEAEHTMDRSHLDLPLDSDPQVERLFFGDHDDVHGDYIYEEDSPTHDLHFLHEDYNSQKPFPPRCQYEVSSSDDWQDQKLPILIADATMPNGKREEVR